MISSKQALVGFFLGVVLLSAVGTAAFAQCGPLSEDNTACGNRALANNTSGSQNSAFGSSALVNNTTGYWNTASGVEALFGNTTGNYNTASGDYALEYNTTGSDNTATGYYAMEVGNTTGTYNTATGAYALEDDTSGSNNIATGAGAAQNNTTGSGNLAEGGQTLYSNKVGSSNTALGGGALKNSTSSNNIGVGFKAGWNITTGSNNIEIGSLGVASDASSIRIGTQGTQRATYIAGIFGTSMSGGSDVVVNNSGHLGVLPSSARYKRDIQPLDERSNKIWQLHPVTFRYRQDPQQRQYGLIAEEVAKVYPELVVRGDKGEIESVQYRELIPLMLNEMQRQQAALTALKAQNTSLQARLERLEQARKTLASR